MKLQPNYGGVSFYSNIPFGKLGYSLKFSLKAIFLDEGFSERESELRARLVHGFVNQNRMFSQTCDPPDSPGRQKIIDDFIKLVTAPVH